MTYDQRIASRFTYHPPKNQSQIDRYEQIRELGGQMATALEDRCPGSPELTMAINMIDQAVMWANASIARNE